MKKIILPLFLLCILAANSFGQEMLNTRTYAEIFGFNGGVIDPASEYNFTASRAERRNFSYLAGVDVQIDTPLEFALLSYYSQPVLNIRPAEADAILPKNNPKLADQKLGAAVFQEIQILRFLADTAAVNRHETVLKFITDRGNATRAEIEQFYRDNVRALIAAVVDEEFKGITIPASTVSYVKDSLTNFFTTPNQANFNVLKRIYDTTNDNVGSFLSAHQTQYAVTLNNIRDYENMNMPRAAASARATARTQQNLLNERRRQLNAPNDAPIDWSGFSSGYIGILNGLLNTELVKRITQQ